MAPWDTHCTLDTQMLSPPHSLKEKCSKPGAGCTTCGTPPGKHGRLAARVRAAHLLEDATAEALGGRGREHGMRGARVDLARALRMQHARRVCDRTCMDTTVISQCTQLLETDLANHYVSVGD